MKETEIRKYAKLMKELELSGLEITEDNVNVRLERNVVSQRENTYTISESTAVNETLTDSKKDYVSIKSPIVGVFYAAPTENAAPYVTEGDNVKQGQVLCIVEAMKLMNEIIADEDCVISKVCVTNGQVVEYGTELFQIKKSQ